MASCRSRSYAPSGKTPVTFAVGGTRRKLSMIATVASRMIIDEAFNPDKLIEFPGTLIKDTEKKVFLIPEKPRVHHNKPVKKWAEEHKEKMGLFYLPGCSPERNPEERLNADLKRAISTRVPARTKAKLKTAATGRMQTLEKSPERIKKYFPRTITH